MMQPDEVVRHFADWCAIWADEEPDDTYYADYLNNYTIIADDEAEEFLAIDVRLGAFDHGAGNALLIVTGRTQKVDYEGEVKVFAIGPELRNLP